MAIEPMLVDEAGVDRVVAALRRGEVVVIPTDTVYGLGADPQNPEAMRRLFETKERPDGVPVAVLVSSLEQARSLISWTDEIGAMATTHWPGALTIVGESLTGDLHVGGGGTIGVRVPDHDFVRSCAARFGPIATTSANKHGQPTITEPAQTAKIFGGQVDVVVDGGALDGIASTVVDATVVPATVLRQGVVELNLSA